MCQSPSRRGTHFYSNYRTTIISGFAGVNPLHVGELISTCYWIFEFLRRYGVSIPFTSGNSFLLNSNADINWIFGRCQSPSRRGTHFYFVAPYVKLRNLVYVSIPFTSGNSFLHPSGKKWSKFLRRCQSPSRRGTHFYSIIVQGGNMDKTLCQSPSRRGTHFYEDFPCSEGN